MVEEKPTLQCSCEVAYKMAKCKKLHTIAEKHIKPCAEKMVEIMIGSGVKKKIQRVLLFNGTVGNKFLKEERAD